MMGALAAPDKHVILRGALTVLPTLQAMYKSYGSCRELMELRNLTSVGELILMSALQRRGSCGGHYCIDDPASAVRPRMPQPSSPSLLG